MASLPPYYIVCNFCKGVDRLLNFRLNGDKNMAVSTSPKNRIHQQRNLTEGSIVKNILYLSWPIVVSSLLQTTMGIADTLMVGALGPESLAAVGMSRFIFMVVLVFILSVSTGSQVFVARYFGAEDKEGATRVTDQALILSGILAVALMSLGLLLSPVFLKALGAEHNVLTLGIPYMQIIFGGVFFMVLNFIISSILDGAGETRVSLKILFLINVINIVLNYFLIFGIGGFPRLGIQGAAWGTVISRTLGAAMGLWILWSGRFAIRTNIFARLVADLPLMRKIINIGLPVGFQGIIRSTTGTLLLWFVANTVHGTYAIAALTIGLQVEAISFMPGIAFGSGATTLVGQNLGAQKPCRAKKSGLNAIWIATFLMSAVGAGFCIFAEQIITMFTEDIIAISIGADYLRIIAYSQPFLALIMVSSGSLRGAGDTKTPLIYSIIHSWFVRIPLIYLLGFSLGLQTTGIWWALTISTVTQGLATYWKFRQGKWQEIKL